MHILWDTTSRIIRNDCLCEHACSGKSNINQYTFFSKNKNKNTFVVHWALTSKDDIVIRSKKTKFKKFSHHEIVRAGWQLAVYHLDKHYLTTTL